MSRSTSKNLQHVQWMVVLLCWSGLESGCGSVLSIATVSTPQSILKAVKSRPDRVTLDIFQVRVPADDKELASELWQATDEQRIDFEVRNRLVSNGFRVGVIGGVLPDRLSRSLNLQGHMPEEQTDRIITEESAAPKVVRRVLQLSHREPATIQTSDVQESLHVLLNTESGLQGKSYKEVQGVYSLRAQTIPAQQVEIQLTPELQYGELRNRYSPSDQGIFVMTPSRERKIFDQMKMSVALSPGEMLVVAGVPGTSSSLGSAFHTERHGDSLEQRLVLIRVAQVPDSEILAEGPSPAR